LCFSTTHRSDLYTPSLHDALPIWPDTLAVRDLNSRLKPSVRLAELILGEQSCGSVVANYLVRPGEIFLERLDYEQATIEMGVFRSEEHTSELQSRFDLVCRLLLEK